MALRRFLRDSLFYGAANVVARGFSFLLLPIYTRALTQEEVGAYELLAAISMSLLALLPMEITQSVARMRTQDMAKDQIEEHVRTAFGFTLAVFGLFCVGIVLGFPWLSVWLLKGDFDRHLLVFAAILLFLNGSLYFLQNELRWSSQAGRYASTSLVTASTTAGFAVLFLAVYDWGVLGLYGALILGVAAGSVEAIRHLPQLLWFRIERRYLVRMLAFSAPLALSSLSIILATTLDRLMIARLLDLESLGQYGVAIRVAAMAMLAFQGFQLAVLPATVGQADSNKREENLEQSFRIFLLIAISVASGLGALAPEILRFMATEAYSNSAVYIPIILIGTVFSATYPFAPGLWLRGHAYIMALVGIGLVLVSLLANWVLIPRLGLMGAAIACAITGVSYCLVMFWASDRVFPVGRHYGSLFLVCGAFVCCGGVMARLLVAGADLSWRFALAALTSLFAMFLLTSREERARALQTFKSKLVK